jgi:hypothetical protein
LENRFIELQDSKVEEVRIVGKSIVLTFSEAYIHKSKGRPGFDPGTGWIQRIRLEFENASLDGEPKELPDRIIDGELEVGRARSGGINLPFDSNETVLLSLGFQRGNEIQIFGETMKLKELNEPKYAEEFPGN